MVQHNVIVLRPQQRARSIAVDPRMAAALALVAIEALLFAGLVAAFLSTRVAAAVAWPPPGQPWFPIGETAINSAALLISGVLVFRAARAWEDPEARIAPLLFGAVLLGSFFLFFQGVVWLDVIGAGLRPTAGIHGRFFCLIVAMHAAHSLGALALLAIVWLRLEPLRDDGAPARPRLRDSAFSAARIPWYFAVGLWPVLYLALYL